MRLLVSFITTLSVSALCECLTSSPGSLLSGPSGTHGWCLLGAVCLSFMLSSCPSSRGRSADLPTLCPLPPPPVPSYPSLTRPRACPPFPPTPACSDPSTTPTPFAPPSCGLLPAQAPPPGTRAESPSLLVETKPGFCWAELTPGWDRILTGAERLPLFPYLREEHKSEVLGLFTRLFKVWGLRSPLSADGDGGRASPPASGHGRAG